MIKPIFLVIGAVACMQAYTINKENKDLLLIDSISIEEKCVMQGGMCVIESDCPLPTTTKGLCPKQRHMGVECCYGVSVKETRCNRHGGSCASHCHERYTNKNTTDCPENTVCCVYVRY